MIHVKQSYLGCAIGCVCQQPLHTGVQRLMVLVQTAELGGSAVWSTVQGTVLCGPLHITPDCLKTSASQQDLYRNISALTFRQILLNLLEIYVPSSPQMLSSFTFSSYFPCTSYSAQLWLPSTPQDWLYRCTSGCNSIIINYPTVRWASILFT